MVTGGKPDSHDPASARRDARNRATVRDGRTITHGHDRLHTAKYVHIRTNLLRVGSGVLYGEGMDITPAPIEKAATAYLGSFSSERHEPDPTFDLGGRRALAIIQSADGEVRTDAAIEEADVVSSELGNGLHAPCIDVDVPMRIVPSTTPGHGHLYIDVAMDWEQYIAILEALAAAGVVERGYVMASEFRKGTHVRLPWVKKAPEEVPFP